MNDAAQCLFTWWDVMANMHAKYGTSPDIEEKPEWETLREAQESLLKELARLTGASQQFLFDTVQVAMFEVLGVEDPITLTPPQAQTIVENVVEKVALEESRMLDAKGLLN